MNPVRPVTVFVVGAAKSGTSTLHKALDTHPNVFMSPQKEPNYFSASDLQKEDKLNKRNLVTSLESYQALFTDAGPDQLLGESSVSYLAYPDVAERIFRYNPDARIIISLREPVSRAISHHAMELRLGYCRVGLDTIFHNPEKHADFHRHYIGNGRYYDRVLKFIERFGERQVFVSLFEDLEDDYRQLIHQLYSFLDVDPDIARTIEFERENTAKTVKNPLLSLLYKNSWLRTQAQKYIPERLRHRLEKTLFEHGKAAQIDSSLQRELHSYYRDDRQALEQLLGRDLSAWDSSSGPALPNT